MAQSPAKTKEKAHHKGTFAMERAESGVGILTKKRLHLVSPMIISSWNHHCINYDQLYIYVIISYIPKKHHKSPINMISPSNSTLFISSNSGQVMPRDIEMWIAWALHRSKTPQKGSTAKGSGRPVCAPKALNAWHAAEAHHCWGDFEESKAVIWN